MTRNQSPAVLHLLMSVDSRPGMDCLQSCRSGDTVVLLDQAIMRLVSDRESLLREFPCPVVVLQGDFEARIGTSVGLPGMVRFVDEKELVDLIVTHPHCLGWR